MNKEEKDLKNDVLDVLEDYNQIVSRMNTGKEVVCRVDEGKFDSDLKKLNKLIRSFRDATVILEK